MGNRHTTFAPHGVYPCSGEEQWVALAAESEEQWAALCAFADAGWDADPRFAENDARKQHEDELDAAIAAWTAGQERDGLAQRLQQAGLPAAPVLDAHEVAADPVFRERQYVVETDHPEAGTHPQVGRPFQFSKTPARVNDSAPMLGEHSFEVFHRFLGMTREEYDELERKNVTGTGPPE
jgi:benzylsuccinate CoA-transferase BbsF subunit